MPSVSSNVLTVTMCSECDEELEEERGEAAVALAAAAPPSRLFPLALESAVRDDGAAAASGAAEGRVLLDFVSAMKTEMAF